MVIIPQNQALDRWDTIPQSLRDALFSEPNSDFLEQTCIEEHVPTENIPTISQIVGYVLLGFLHPEDIAREITERTGIDSRVAKAIQDALIGRIFVPLKTDLDKTYNPLAKSDLPKVTPMGIGPKIIQDVGGAGPRPLSTPPPAPPKPVSSLPNAATSMTGTNMSVGFSASKMPAAPAPQFPKPLPQVGWSKTQTDAPVVRLDVTRSTAPQAARPPIGPAARAAASPSAIPSPASSSNESMTGGPVGEFERLGMTPPHPTSPSSPAAPAPAPVMLHQDDLLKPIEKTNDFHLSRPGANPEVDLSTVSGQTAPKAAIIEIGGKPSPTAPKAPEGPAAVHYTSFTPSLSSASTADSGPRNVSQITGTPPQAPSSMAAQAKAAIPPTPPPPPAPRPGDLPGKVIVKDFLGPNSK